MAHDHDHHHAHIVVYLTVHDGEAAIDFYKRGFGAVETFKQLADDRKRVMHATLSMFGEQVMLSDEFPEYSNDTGAPRERGASVAIHINLHAPAEVDAAMDRAARAGATVTLRAQDTFWGMRYGRLRDPFGHVWAIGAPLPGTPDEAA